MKKTKRILSFVLAVLMLMSVVPMGASAKTTAATGQCGENAYWTFDEATGKLVIYGSGDMYDYDDLSPFYDNDAIKSVVIEEGITSVGRKAFKSCGNLTDADLPKSITAINSNAFYQCKKLKDVNLSENLVHIGTDAFNKCESFEKVTIPKSVNSMGIYCFWGCGIKELVIDGCETIGKTSFMSCKNLEIIIIRKGTKNIDKSAFDGCKKVKVVYLPTSISKISSFAFAGNNALKDVYYEGNKEMFKKISIAMMNEDLEDATIHYNSGYPEIHIHEYKESIISPTCTEQGYTEYVCECGESYKENFVDALGHKDDNKDYKCDNGCGYEFEKPVDPIPDTPSKDCSCMCHKTGLMSLLWKIMKFFYKMFGVNKECICGVAHY